MAFRLHHALTLAAGIASLLLLSTAQAQNAQAQNGGGMLSLLEATERFQAAWGVDISYAANILDNRFTTWSRPVADTAERDLQVLLVDTGVTYTLNRSGTFLLHAVRPQLRGTITGTVTDSLGTPLPNAHVVNKEDRSHGTTTDRNGVFVLDALLPGPLTLEASHVGFATSKTTVTVEPSNSTHINFQLSLFILEPGSLEVIASPLESPELPVMFVPRSLIMDTRSSEELNQPGGLGTKDPIHSLRDVSGVYLDQNTSSIHIQGSGFGEHQILLDDNPVYAPFHLGLVGALSPLAIGNAQILKAGFDTAQGSFLAGVIQTEHALYVSEPMRPLDVQIDPLSFNGRFNSRLQVGDASVRLMAGIRSSIWKNWWSSTRSASIDSLLRSWNTPDVFLMQASLFPLKRARPDSYARFVQQLQQVPDPALPDFGFDDVHLAGRITLVRGHELDFSWYRGGNFLRGRYPIAVEVEEDSSLVPNDQHDWLNENTRVAWSHFLNSRTKLIAAWRKGFYDFTHRYGGLDRQNSVTAAFNAIQYDVIPTNDFNQITDHSISASLLLEHAYGEVETGLEQEYSRHRFAILHVLPRELEHARRSVRSAAFMQQIFRPWRWIGLTAGSRFTWLHAQDRLYSEPRIAVQLRSRSSGGYGAALRLATGVYYQFLNQFEIGTISPSTAVPSTRLWLPVDETLPAPMSIHYSADFSAQLWTDWVFRFEYYYKDQKRLYRIDYPKLWRQDEIPGTISSISQFVTLTHGTAFGTSVELNHVRDRLEFGGRYEYGKSRREFAFRNGELRVVPVPWNVPRQIQLHARTQPLRMVEAFATWRGAWGRLWAFRQSYYDLLGTDVRHVATFDDYDFRDPTAPGHELGPHKQLDLGLALNVDLGNSHRLQFRADVLNALDRKNPAYLFVREQTEDESRQLTTETSYLLGRTLSLSMHLSW